MQVKLLRLIQTGAFRRVGGTETLHSDFRLVAATHKRLLEMTRDGRFREDLYYRISAFPIGLPSLRERRGDIVLLVDSILQRIGNAGDAGGRSPGHKLTAIARYLQNSKLIHGPAIFANCTTCSSAHVFSPMAV